MTDLQGLSWPSGTFRACQAGHSLFSFSVSFSVAFLLLFCYPIVLAEPPKVLCLFQTLHGSSDLTLTVVDLSGASHSKVQSESEESSRASFSPLWTSLQQLDIRCRRSLVVFRSQRTTSTVHWTRKYTESPPMGQQLCISNTLYSTVSTVDSGFQAPYVWGLLGTFFALS